MSRTTGLAVQHQKTSLQEAGQHHQRGTVRTRTSVQTPCLTASKGPSRGLGHGRASRRTSSPPPLPVFITCYDTTACKQSAGRFWVMCLVQHKLDQKIFPAENVGHWFKILLFLKQNPPILYTEQAGKQSEN